MPKQYLQSQAPTSAEIVNETFAALKGDPTRPIDLIDIASDWLDDGMRTYFISGSTAYYLQLIRKTLIGNHFSYLFNGGWNYVDTVGGVASGISQIIAAESAKRHEKEKIAWGMLDIGLSAQLAAGTTMTLLSQYGVVQGVAAAAFAPLGGFGFAACMWGALVKALFDLHHARKKTNMGYLFIDRIKKIEAVEAKLRKLVSAGQTQDIDDDKLAAIYKKALKEIPRLKKEYEAWKSAPSPLKSVNENPKKLLNSYIKFVELYETRDRLRTQALAIFETNEGNKTEFDDVIAKYSISKNIKKRIKKEKWREKYKLTRNKKIALATHLKAKERDDMINHAVFLASMSFAAVGMTLIACAPFFPPLLVPGIVIASIGAAIKAGELIYKYIIKQVMNKQKVNEIEEHLIEKYNFDNVRANGYKDLSDAKCLRFKLAYELCKDDFKNHPDNANIDDEAELERKFYDILRTQLSTRKMNTFLESAFKHTVEDEIINEALQDHNNSKKDLLTKEDKATIFASLSDNDRQSIINRQCRKGARHRFFKSMPKPTIKRGAKKTVKLKRKTVTRAPKRPEAPLIETNYSVPTFNGKELTPYTTQTLA